MIALGGGYSYSSNVVAESRWSEYLLLFDDATLYQTRKYARATLPYQGAGNIVVRRGGDVVGIAQARLVTVPLLGRGIAYVAWGPLWRRGGVRWECTAFRAALGGLREEFVVRRRLLLQVVPNVVDEGPAWARAALEDAGFQRIGSGRPYRTIMVDLQRPLEEIRKCLAQKWRNCLNSALRTDLEIREGSSEAEYATFLSLYAAMRKRKAFDCGVDVDRWGDMQAALPDREKLRVFTAYSEGSPVAAVVASCMGDTGRYLLGATGEQGLKTKASYALHWRVIERLVERGFRQYDLGGIDPEKNPGGYQFKSRMGGREVRFLGSFQCCQSVASRIAVSVGVGLRKLARRCR